MWESRFSWVEPLKPTIWNLFDIGLKTQGQVRQNWLFLRVTDPSFDTFLTTSNRYTEIADANGGSAVAVIFGIIGALLALFFQKLAIAVPASPLPRDCPIARS